MIIQCEQCQTRFRLDDSKVTDKGVKVRCAKCRHVFAVRKEQPQTEVSDFSPSLEQTAVAARQTDSGENPVSDALAPPVPVPAPSFSFGDDVPEEQTDGTVRMESGLFGAPLAVVATSSTARDQFGFSSLQEDQSVADEPDHKPLSPGEVGFTDFDFGDSGAEADGSLAAEPLVTDFADKAMLPAPTAADPAKDEEAQGLDFSDDDMFGAVVQPAAEEPADSITFDFGTDSFADSMNMGGSDSGQKGSSNDQESTGEAPFSLGEIDFGDELTAVAVQQVNPDELKPSQKILFAPLAQAQEKPAEDDEQKRVLLGILPDDQEELPPLSITSRRKQSPFFTALISAAALLVVGVLGYYGYSTFSSDKGSVAQEAGKISVRAVKAAYVQNATAGTLLVISGEALNEYSKPRAALQVKGTMFDAGGRVLATKIVYCGNPLTNEQLLSLPLDKIEAAMSNQFGDSLANLEVSAGKAVPFTIVIANPAKEGQDFAVEPAGSTVATGKQQ
ncbi:MAG: zinc-ribbon domain-containing protein [Steroidobacteraceae bacterium]|nr:zinc-ribbon domain-containing protein [Deltaproteobacteria bacterium]